MRSPCVTVPFRSHMRPGRRRRAAPWDSTTPIIAEPYVAEADSPIKFGLVLQPAGNAVAHQVRDRQRQSSLLPFPLQVQFCLREVPVKGDKNLRTVGT